jgi:SAM-dependent methyltransferase
VTFVGLLGDRQALANFYAMCDVVAVPSRTDSFASVQVEAMLCGTPVVCSDIPGAREVVRETGMGELVSPGDPDALADAILRVSSDRATYVARAGVVRAVFDADRSVDEYERVLVEAHGARRRSASAPGSLTDADRALLDRILRNEADMAFRRRTRELLEYLELRDGDGVLDVGCGMGFSLMAMSKLRDVTLTGIDSDPERLAWAQREGVPAEFVHADAERLPFADDSFDKVLASEVLEHLTDDCAALVEMARVLRPGGVLAISVPNARFPFAWDPISGALRAMGRPGFRTGRVVGIWTNHVRLYTVEDLSERVRGAGLEVEILEETTHYTVPFQHFLVYGIGKPLFERGLLPERLRRSADRFAGQENSGSLFDPFNAGRAVFRAIDRLNDRPEAARKRTHVNVLVKARKPPAP